LEDLGLDGRMILKLTPKKEIRNWSVFIWPRIGTDGRLF
jgi:hypothetical protein